MKFKYFVSSLLLMAVMACNQSAKESVNSKVSATGNQEQKRDGVYFVNLKDGDNVKSPFIIEMGVKGMEVEPAGKLNEGKGHHHLIIDGSFTEKGQMVAKDETHLHFGKGQTSDTLSLSPGTHTLTLQFANGLHQSYGQDWSNTISVTVEN